MAADLTYDVKVNVSDATRNLDRLNNRVETISKSFTLLRNALGGLALGSFITSTLRWADSISDLSDATGLAIANIQGFSDAVVASGGTLEGAQKAILQFQQSLGEARAGEKAQYTFEQLGVSINDLARLSDQEIFNKIIEQLGKITNLSKAATLSNDLFGKSLRGTELKGLAQAYPSATANASASSSAVKDAADAFQNFQTILKDIRTSLIENLQPISQFIKELKVSKEGIDSLVKTLMALIGVIGGFWIVGKITKVFLTLAESLIVVKNGMTIFSKAWTWLIEGLVIFKDAFKTLLVVLTRSGSIFSKIADIFVVLGVAIGGVLGFFVRLAGVVGIVYSIYEAVKFLNDAVFKWQWLSDFTDYIDDAFDNAITKIKEYLGLQEQVVQGGGGEFRGRGATGTWSTKEDDEAAAKKAKEEADARQAVIDRNKELRLSLIAVTQAYKDQNEERLMALGQSLQEMTMSEDLIERMRVYNDIYQDANKRVKELKDRKAALKPEEQAVAAVIDQQIAAIHERAEIDIDTADLIIDNIQRIRNAQTQLQRDYEIAGEKARDNLRLDEMQAQLQTIGLYGDALEETNSLLAIEAELKSKLLEIDLRRQQLQLDATKLGPERLAAELANLALEEKAARDYADRRLQIERERIEKEKQLRQDASAGVAAAFEEIKNMMDPFKMAQDSVMSVFNNMSSALDTFVQTGKFKFKDFALSVIRDLIAIQARMALVGLFKTIGMAIGIPGLASGGPARAGQAYVVGEQGPELFVPKTSGDVIPNNKMGSNGTALQTQDTPRIVNYNYNINAVDAKSVAQLLYENRRTLLGTVRIAQGEMPARAG